MFSIRQFLKALRIIPKATTEIDTQGEFEVLNTDGKARYHNGTTASPVVTESHAANLTNKDSISSQTGNNLDLNSTTANVNINAGVNANITTTNATGSNNSGGITTTTGTTVSGNSGNTTILGGNSVDGTAGGIFFSAGEGTGTGTGGAINIQAGASYNTTGADVNINAGGSLTGTGGALNAGTSTRAGSGGSSGAINIVSGTLLPDPIYTGTGNKTGDVRVASGETFKTLNNTGNVTVTSGNTPTTGAQISGDLALSTGVGGDSGSGKIDVISGTTASTTVASGAVLVSSGTQTGTQPTGTLTLKTGNKTTSGNTGTISLTSGDNSGTGGTGTVTVQAGTLNGTQTGVTSGGINLRSGAVTTAGNNSGGVTIRSGNTPTSGAHASGSVNVFTGVGGNNGSGGINIISGDTASTTAASGEVYLQSGLQTGTQPSGNLTLRTGDKATNGVTGTVSIQSGAKTSTGTGNSGGITLASGAVSSTDAAAVTGAITIASGNNTGSGNSGNVNIQAGTASTGTRGKVILSSETTLPALNDSTSTGATATISTISTSNLRVSNASLTGITNLKAGGDGQILTLQNSTGNSVSLLNDTGGTASQRIITGTGANLSLANNSSINLIYDNTATRWKVIGGTGSGSTTSDFAGVVDDYNLIVLDSTMAITRKDNTGAEATIGNWVAYADAAGVLPVDMTGGTPNTAITRSTSGPLMGTAMFSMDITSGATRQGEGISCQVFVPKAYRGKKLRFSMEVEPSTGMFNGDVVPAAYDVTNSSLIPVQIKSNLNQNTKGTMIADFFVPVGTLEIRVGLHIARSTGTIGGNIRFDDVKVKPVFERDIPKNYIPNPDFENNANGGWTLGNVTLTNKLPTGVPTFGSGFSGNLFFNQTVALASSISGTRSATLDDINSPIAGNFLSTDPFTIDKSDQAKVLSFSFNYQNLSGSTPNFSGTSLNTYAVAIYDITNSSWIIPAGVFNLVQGTGVGRCTGSFQTPSNASQLRFVIYFATANANPCAITVDDFFLGPQTTVSAPAMSDWVAYTPTGTWSTNTTYEGKWRRVGDSAEYMVRVSTTGAPTSSELRINLASGQTIDTTKLPDTGTVSAFIAGTGNIEDSSAFQNWSVIAEYFNTTSVRMRTTAATADTKITSVTQAVPMTWAASDSLAVSFKLPISGWSSNSVMSQDTDTRVVMLRANQGGSTQGLTAGVTAITFVAQKDTHGAWSGSQYTVPVAGDYRVSVFLYSGSDFTSEARVNGTLRGYIHAGMANRGGGGSIILDKLIPGDIITIRGATSITVAGDTGQSLSIDRLSGPAVVAASEKVYLEYTNNGGAAVTASVTNIDWITRVVDSHLAWNGTTFTAPRSGWYYLQGGVGFTTGNTATMQLYKNGVQIRNVSGADASSGQKGLSGAAYLNAGDTWTIRSSGSLTLSNGSFNHYICISSQG
jgi:hypothetical protein